MKPICKNCGNTNTLSASTTSRWKSTGKYSGYWIITSDPEAEIDNCDVCGENPTIKYVDKPIEGNRNFKVPSYDQRVSNIRSKEDIEKQIELAERYTMRLRKARKKATLLKDKIDLSKVALEAELVARELRRNVFHLEDQLSQ